MMISQSITSGLGILKIISKYSWLYNNGFVNQIVGIASVNKSRLSIPRIRKHHTDDNNFPI